MVLYECKENDMKNINGIENINNTGEPPFEYKGTDENGFAFYEQDCGPEKTYKIEKPEWMK